MKHATHDNGLIRDAQGTLIGVNLGWDFAAEHEWGIKGLRQKLGIDSFGYGPDRHLIRDVRAIRSEEFVIKGHGKGKNKTPDQTWYVISCHHQKDAVRYLPAFYRPEADVISAWAGDVGFVVGIKDKSVHDAILAALTANDAILTNDNMFASEGNPFSGSGLKIVIHSAIPKDWRENWIEAHLDHERLADAARATGIEAKLKAAGKGWYALSPRWTNDKRQTVRFFLNPMEQDQNNSGVFSVEDLEEWIIGTGPIPKKQ